MKRYENIEELKRNSICINGSILVNFMGNEEWYSPRELEKFNGRYATNNSTLSYVDNNTLYVTPWTSSAIQCLSAAGFTNDYFYVPFSNGDYPIREQFEWRRLRSMAMEEYREEFVDGCAAICDKKKVGELSPDVLSACFEMPYDGVKVNLHGGETVYYPIIDRDYCVDCTVVDKLGGYQCNNGKVVFVYRNGRTYVARGYWILDHLRHAGYFEAPLFVPFSNGETVLDSFYRNKLENLEKK